MTSATLSFSPRGTHIGVCTAQGRLENLSQVTQLSAEAGSEPS